ncbi:MAG: hypothetical protein IKW49_01715 [Opitutales bacterium]|nr:hypothetical protein [Opitutales bacterium]
MITHSKKLYAVREISLDWGSREVRKWLAHDYWSERILAFTSIEAARRFAKTANENTVLKSGQAYCFHEARALPKSHHKNAIIVIS